MVKWNGIFVRSIRGLQNFLAIPIMNLPNGVHDKNYSYLYYMHVETGLSPALTLKVACDGKNA